MSQTKAQLLDGKSATIQFTGGSASAPSVSFTGDTNTGIYSPGADQVAISTGGSGKLFVDASGNVGVSATPTALGTSVRTLEIKGAATNRSGGLSLTSSDNSANAFFYTFDNVSYLGTTATPLSFFTNNTERLRITSAGLVGIGTSSPGDVLHVKGSSTYAGVIADNSAATGGGAFRAYRNGVQKAVFCVDSWVTGTSSDDAAIYADAGGGIKFYTNNSSTAKAVLTSGGSLGIGTTSPGQALHVIGNIQVGDSGNERGIYVGAAGFSGAFLYRPTGDVQLSPRSGYGITFAPAPGSATEWGRWDSSGRLLVGTSTARSNFFNSTETADFQVESTNGLASIIRNTNATGGPGLILGKTRSTSVGGTTIVQSGDLIGAVSFQGSDGSEFVAAASVEAYVDGTPGANDMPGRLVFSTTADGASSPTERMRIKANGTTCIGTTTEGTMSGDAVVAIGPNIGIISKRASVAASGTVDININTGGGGYQGFLIVANTNNSNAAIRTHTTFSVFGRGTDSSIQQIATDNGTTSGASFTVTTPSNGVIRVTNTTAATTDVDIQFFGGTSG